MRHSLKHLTYDLTKFSVYRLREKATGKEITGYVHAEKGVFFGNGWHSVMDFAIDRRVNFAELMEFFDQYADWPQPVLEGMTCKFV